MITLSLVDIILLGVLSVFFISVFLFSRSGNDLAPNSPAAYRAAHPHGRVSRGGRKLAVCAGDSLTRGAVSVDFVSMLASRLPDWDFVNAGVNADLAFNLGERVGEIAALDPDAVTILIGTNDVNATFGFQAAYGYIAAKRLPERPSPLFYRECLVGIVRTLKRATQARIALFSIPPIGEDPGHYAYIRTEDYAGIIKEIASEEGVEYLPLRERLCSYIESLPTPSPPPLGFRSFGKAQLDAGRAQRHFGKSLDEISASNRFRLLVDGIHLNSHGAAIAAELAEGFLRRIK
jgi:lysophospholipase L1-like esterase